MRYFVNDPEDGVEFFDTEQEARDHAEHVLQQYRDLSVDGWDECVTWICWGEVKERVVQTICRPAEQGSGVDEYWDFGLRADEREARDGD